MASDHPEIGAFAAEQIEATVDAIASPKETIGTLERRGFDTVDAQDRLVRLEKKLQAWMMTKWSTGR